MNRAIPLSALVLTVLGAALAQTPAELMNDPAVRAAFDAIKRNEPASIEQQIKICEIPAPPFHEDVRGQELKRLFEGLGLHDVRVDRVGNVIGVRPGKAAHPNLVFAAHLDTVFPEGTDVKVKVEGDILKAPGIGDDCRGLALMLGVIRALNQAHVETPGTITFVADVGEEGLGDLRGMKELFGATLKGQIDKFFSVDGLGLSIDNVGVGSNRYRVTFKGPGGHSYGAFGMANPIQAMGRAIAKIDEIQVPAKPKTTFNVGRVGGGTSVNAIPFECWMEVDMRSADAASLKAVDEQFKKALQEAVEEENKRWNNRGPVSVSAELVGLRPGGQTDESNPIVQTAMAVNRAMGFTATLHEGSTDANVAMNLGIPAITIGGGGSGSGAHSLGETFNTKNSWEGTERALLLAVSLAR
ncbi:MAG TPA: M20/M25/M40 family metallo-hydrolase [Bryobacteraceae bacterium]|jgi:acetylornithine deacetylase/succinyl-diaminopimelate desuccinylase-like protein|nr:M20/M25/M40 family metallo-hydrolase [Bryobacteraceae bacterium]